MCKFAGVASPARRQPYLLPMATGRPAVSFCCTLGSQSIRRSLFIFRIGFSISPRALYKISTNSPLPCRSFFPRSQSLLVLMIGIIIGSFTRIDRSRFIYKQAAKKSSVVEKNNWEKKEQCGLTARRVVKLLNPDSRRNENFLEVDYAGCLKTSRTSSSLLFAARVKFRLATKLLSLHYHAPTLFLQRAR